MVKCFYILCFILLSSTAFISCGSDSDKRAEHTVSLDVLLADTPIDNKYDLHLDSAPDQDCVKLKIKHIGPLRKAFRDSNYLHLEAASRLGIDAIGGIDDVWRLSRPLVEIKSCREYYVDNLTHSYPFLVVEAADLLKEIGQRFNDSLQARGGGSYRLKVTSVLRTDQTVKRLRRINRNATDASAHQFGTTFDISYSRFICDSVGVNRTFEDLKNLLGEILFDLREDGRCYVVYERKQSCFHITVRPNDNDE